MAGAKVLLVDDEEDFVDALSERLETRDIAVTVARSGKQALEQADGARFDAIILDLAMPGMDGIETLKALRADQPDVHVILLTGHGSLQKGVEAMKLGAMDFLEKPADINVLMEKIREARSSIEEAEEQRTKQIISDILKTKGW